MKKIAILLTFVAALFLISCDNETPIVPSDISNVRAESRPGAIFLAWDRPADLNYEQLWIRWFDPLTQSDRFWVSSVYADTVLIPNTRAKFGTYTFTLQTESSTGTLSNNVHTISAVSLPAPITTILGALEVLPLTAAQLSTNAQQPTEGPIEHLLTDDANQFFHSRWGAPVPPAPHWIQVDLGRVIDTDTYYRIWYRRRMQNNNNRPTDFDLMGSMDGDNWFLLRNFTQEEDNLPTTTAVNDWTSPNLFVTEPFRHIRISVNATNSNTIFFTMSGFRFYVGTVTVIDPEADGR